MQRQVKKVLNMSMYQIAVECSSSDLFIGAVFINNEGSTEVIAHAPMLDLGGLIKPGTVVRMTKSKPGGKTSHAVQLVQVLETECSVARCCINSLKTIPFLCSAALRTSSKGSICFCRLPLFSWQCLLCLRQLNIPSQFTSY